MKEHKHLGVYGLVVKDEQILLIKKVTGPYDGKLDLPGGTMEFGERPEETLERELLDADSVFFDWEYQRDTLVRVQHIGIFYKILEYENDIQSKIDIDDKNDDSLGAEFYSIKELTKDRLSAIAILELEKLGYELG